MSTNRLCQQLRVLRLPLKRFLIVTFGIAAIAHAQLEQSTGLDASYRFSAGSDAEFGGAKQGEIETSSFSISTESTRPLSEKLSLKLGLSYQEIFIDATDALPVPDSLRSAKIEVGATWRFSPEWSTTLGAQPGFYSDGESFNSDGFNVPAMLITRWQFNQALTFLGGVVYNSFSEDELTPVFGLRWQVSPRVVAMIGAPRTEISYELREGHRLFVNASLQGGNYHIDDASITPPVGYPSLRDTEVAYREIYVGAGYAWPLTKNLSAEVEAGWMADRRFDYNDRGLVVKTEGAPTARFSLNARF